MASEAACLGTPSFYINSLSLGYCNEIENKYGLLFNFRSSIGLIEKMNSVLNNISIIDWAFKREKLLTDKIDVTSYLIWFIENYPKSSTLEFKINGK
jgi:hypothetical protein